MEEKLKFISQYLSAVYLRPGQVLTVFTKYIFSPFSLISKIRAALQVLSLIKKLDHVVFGTSLIIAFKSTASLAQVITKLAQAIKLSQAPCFFSFNTELIKRLKLIEGMRNG